MTHPIRPAPHRSNPSRERIWAGCLPERPHCSVPGCEHPAHTVDPFFPYLDDWNRCDRHTPALAPAYVAEPQVLLQYGFRDSEPLIN